MVVNFLCCFLMLFLGSFFPIQALSVLDKTSEPSTTVNPKKDNPKKEVVGIMENLGAQIPLDLSLIDESGKPLLLKDFITLPTIVSFVYYRCPGICSPLLGGMVDVVDEMELVEGIDYKVLTISIDPREGADLAAQKKKNYLGNMKRKVDPNAWKWTVGDAKTIKTLTKVFGFGYKQAKDGNFIHAASIMAVSPTGKIARYLYGTSFLPFDLKLALAEAAEERTGPTVAKFLKYCFSYDPAGRKYVFNTLQVVGGLLLLWVLSLFAYLAFFGKKRGLGEGFGVDGAK
jgi:protein SCO1